MSKYINLDDPDVTYSHNLGQHEVYIVGTEAERIDIVRCGECKHWHENDFVDGLCYGECDNGIIKKSVWTNEMWFCADAERRADDE